MVYLIYGVCVFLPSQRQKRDEQKAADEARQVEEATEAERTAKLAKEMAEKQAQTDAATADAASAQEAAKQEAIWAHRLFWSLYNIIIIIDNFIGFVV